MIFNFRLAVVLCCAALLAHPSGLLAQDAQAQPAAQEPRFEIRRFVVEGASLIPTAELDAATRSFTGKDKDFADVQRALEAIERLYSNKGYSAVQVILPEQELERGEVQFKVVEARIGKVLVEGNKFFDEANVRASLPALSPGIAPNVNRIARSLKVANENPAKQTTALLRGGTEEGTVDAVIRVTDERPVKFSMTLDNTGTPETGAFRLAFGFQHANLWNRDHVLSAQYVISPHPAENPHSVRLWPNPRVDIFGLAYRMPLYESGNNLEFSAGYSNVRSGIVQGLFGQFNVAGAGSIFGVRYNYNLPKQGELDHRLAFGLDWRGYDNRTTTVAGNQAVLPDVTVHPISVTYAGVFRTSVSETSYYLGGFKNLPGGNDADTKTFDAFRAGAVPGYTLWRFGVAHNQAFSDDWQGRFSMSGQVTRNRLISGEQFGIGGADSIRGFLEREVANDSGTRYSIEAYTPDFGGKIPLISGLRARQVFFYDWGRVKRFNPLPGEIRQQGISSAGFGIRVSHGTNFSLRLDYGVVLDAGGNQGKWEGRPHATASYIF